jgi:hypothetical protein
MGDWRVRLRWRPESAVGHAGRHSQFFDCDAFPECLRVVEQHQPVEGPEVPEFTISVKWQDGNLDEYLAGKNSHAHGWRYIMRWDDPREGKVRHISGYGFSSEDAAREAAEAKATKIVRAQQPEKVYKFTPEV